MTFLLRLEKKKQRWTFYFKIANSCDLVICYIDYRVFKDNRKKNFLITYYIPRAKFFIGKFFTNERKHP
jgi:hypothetical protein